MLIYQKNIPNTKKTLIKQIFKKSVVGSIKKEPDVETPCGIKKNKLIKIVMKSIKTQRKSFRDDNLVNSSTVWLSYPQLIAV